MIDNDIFKQVCTRFAGSLAGGRARGAASASGFRRGVIQSEYGIKRLDRLPLLIEHDWQCHGNTLKKLQTLRLTSPRRGSP